jgi:hypothetical protein
MRSINLLMRTILLWSLLILPLGCGGGGGGGGAPAPTLVSISVIPATATIAAGGSQQFTATGTLSDGSLVNLTSQVTWSVAPTGLVQITTSGLASAPTTGPTGTVSITATSGNITSPPVTLTITPVLVSIAVTPATPSIAAGATQQFIATGTYSNGSTQVLTAQVAWSLIPTGVVQISTAGLVSSAVSAPSGTITVTATQGTVTGFATLSLTGTQPSALRSITVTPANPTLAAGLTQQFIATGTLIDGTTSNVTSQVTWSATPATVAQISTTGLATARSAGTATITAVQGTVSGSTQLTVSGLSANVMALSVNGGLCSSTTSASYFNKPCVSVKVCNPDGSVCQVVNDILLDTGSFGLRIFQQAIPTLTLTQAPSGTGSLAECIQFVDFSTIWGPVKLASVQLANESPVVIPIQVIDAGFPTSPASCGTPDPDPATAGYTGILGVGPLAEDCGSACVNASIGVYYRCNGANCTGTPVSLANQIKNPVASLPVDRNGVLIQLPSAPLGGAPSLDGLLILGIGTQANNTPSPAPTVLPTDQNGFFTTVYNGVSNAQSFADTGSNALYFPSSFPLCSNDPNNVLSNWYCPTTTVAQSATLFGTFGAPSRNVQFNIGNFSNLFFSTNNNVFSEVGGPSDFGFDWGLPFFMGRNVFIGINGTTSVLGTGPYLAF